jgi:hypothetical protein
MRLLKSSLFFGGLLALATSLSAESLMLNFAVPFSFVAAGKVMPAGTYTVEEPSNGGVLLIRGSQPDSSAMVLAVNAGPSNVSHAGVTFSRRGATVVLSAINIPGGSSYALVARQDKTAAAVSVALPRK